jgi:hypothetical protein
VLNRRRCVAKGPWRDDVVDRQSIDKTSLIADANPNGGQNKRGERHTHGTTPGPQLPARKFDRVFHDNRAPARTTATGAFPTAPKEDQLPFRARGSAVTYRMTSTTPPLRD